MIAVFGIGLMLILTGDAAESVCGVILVVIAMGHNCKKVR